MPRPVCALSKVMLPLVGQAAHAGFPSPADDYIEDVIDLNDVLIAHPAATFLWRVAGDCMVDARIFHGDVILVDRSIIPKHRSIVLAVIEGEPAVKRLLKRHGETKLVNENAKLPPFEMNEGVDVAIWGTVTWTLRDMGA